MRPVDNISSNATGLYAVEEIVPGVTPANPVWSEKEPNDYANFGAEIKTVQRMPINANRRNKKGTVVGYTAGAGYTTDLTATNLREDAQGFFFSDMRRKSALVATAVVADGFTVAAGGAAYVPGTILAASGSTIGANDGMHVTGASVDGKVAVAGLVPVGGQAISLTRAGIEFAAGDASLDVAGPLPVLATAAFDLTTLGLIPGEIVYLGGDTVGSTFGTDGMGWCRVKSVSAHALTFDKTDFGFNANDGTGKSIQLFFGNVIRDEDAILQKMRTYSIMRRTGAADLDAPDKVQAEIVTRCVANQLKITVPEEDKITCDLSFMGGDSEYYDDVDTEVPGSVYQAVSEADAINSTGDMKRASLIVYPSGQDNAAPQPLIAFFTQFDITLDNQIKENKAVTRMGTFVLSPGNFKVSGSFTGYFTRVEALRSVRNNADVSFMFAAWKANKGVALDLPMLTLATKGLEVKQNEPVKLPIDTDASTGRKYDPAMAHTALMVFFDYLPNVAND